MIDWLLSIFGRCAHTRTSFPQTDKGKTTVVCLECGRRFDYSWEHMRRGKEVTN